MQRSAESARREETEAAIPSSQTNRFFWSRRLDSRQVPASHPDLLKSDQTASSAVFRATPSTTGYRPHRLTQQTRMTLQTRTTCVRDVQACASTMAARTIRSEVSLHERTRSLDLCSSRATCFVVAFGFWKEHRSGHRLCLRVNTWHGRNRHGDVPFIVLNMLYTDASSHKATDRSCAVATVRLLSRAAT